MRRVTPRPNPLGDLLRERRRSSHIGYKQLYAATGMDRETLRKWETGDTYDVPLRGALLYALEVGISVEELVRTALASEPGADESARQRAEAALRRAAELAAQAQARRGRVEAPAERRPPAG